jgi:UDP-glucuronate 4-epimerase
MKILITGCAGFIGFHVCNDLIKKSKSLNVIGIDNLNNYYDVNLKKKRLKILKEKKNFIFKKIDLSNRKKLEKIFSNFTPDVVINLAAQAGVRYSIKYPRKYFNSNILGFFNLIDLSSKFHIKHFIYASTSSVYGEQKKFPINERMNTNNPLSFYAASKKCNEVIAHSYSFIQNLPTTGLRFFTVYGPYGRPDMALFKFTKAILNRKKIDLYNYGNHIRDFTHISYISSAFQKIIKKKPSGKIPFEIYNIGGSKPESLKKFINILEKTLKKKTEYNYMKLQTGDIHKTHACNKKLKKSFNIKDNNITIENGIKSFVNWYKSFYNVK